jgi:hypothetical protein
METTYPDLNIKKCNQMKGISHYHWSKSIQQFPRSKPQHIKNRKLPRKPAAPPHRSPNPTSLKNQESTKTAKSRNTDNAIARSDPKRDGTHYITNA